MRLLLTAIPLGGCGTRSEVDRASAPSPVPPDAATSDMAMPRSCRPSIDGDPRVWDVDLGARMSTALLVDQDGDGDSDIVSSGPGGTRLLRNDSGGRFTPVPVAAAPFLALDTGDIDGDGFADVLGVHAPSSAPFGRTISVVTARGHDGFSAEQQRVSSGNVMVGRVTDVDGDGRRDLVLFQERGIPNYEVMVLPNEGDGRFGRARAFPLPIAANVSVTGMELSDLDGDGRPDVFVGIPLRKGAGSVIIGFNQGGTFSFTTVSTGPSCEGSAYTAWDVDGDGDRDIATECGVLINHGDRRFEPADASLLVPLGKTTDLDGDGFVDVLDARAPGLTIHRGLGPRQFAKETYGATAAIGFGDFDRDGRLDVAAGGSSGHLRVLLADREGHLPLRTIEAGPGPETTLAVDLDGDGARELVTANAGNLSILRNTGSGKFVRGLDVLAALSTSGGPLRHEGVVAADFDEDGRSDLAVGTQGGPAVVLLNRGGLRFEPGEPLEVAGYEGLAAGDLDEDGHIDLIAVGWNRLSGLDGGVVSIFRNRGAARFERAVLVPVGKRAGSVLVTDVDRDGHADIVATGEADDSVSIVRFGLDERRRSVTKLSVGKVPDALAQGDLNGDGFPELVTANVIDDPTPVAPASQASDWTVTVLWNDGKGGLNRRTDLSVGPVPRAVAVADIDGDGDNDVLTANAGSADITVLANDGNGGLTVVRTLAAGAYPQGLVVADLDGRCGLDIAVANKAGNDLLVHFATPKAP